MSIRMLICDDHEVIRTGLASLLAGTDIEIVGEAANGKDALAVRPEGQAGRDPAGHPHAGRRRAVDLGEAAGEGAGEQGRHALDLRQPDVHRPGRRLGGRDYVLKGSPREDMIATIMAAAAGESPSRTGELKKIAGTMKVRQVIDDDDVPLTQRETQVLRHVALGLSNQEIGKSLEISVETVKEHVQNILRKIAVSDRTQAAVWAVRKGLV